MKSAERQHKSVAFTVGMITAGCGLVLGSILPGTPAFFGFILGFTVGFLVTSAVLYIANSRGNGLASSEESGEESHETEDNIDRGYKSTSKQNRDAG
jgi:hypothetical protein